MQSKQAKISEDIHDYLDELDDLLTSCKLNATMPERAIKARSIVYNEVPKLIEAIEDLTQNIVSNCNYLDAEKRLEAIRVLENVNLNLNELLPVRKNLKVVNN